MSSEKSMLAGSMKEKEQLFDNIAHEFQTPITIILGRIEEELDDKSDTKDRSNLQVIQRSALRLKGLINELMDIPKLKHGKIKVSTKEENIVHLIQEYLE